jgi:beta-glucosidase
MKLHAILILAFAETALLTMVNSTASGQTPLSLAEIESRIDALLGRMTLDEKLGQMSQSAFPRELNDKIRAEIRRGRWSSFFNGGTPAEKASMQQIARNESRLGIPLIFGHDVIHGYRTAFPIPLGQAASWDAQLVRRAAHCAAQEASADGINWTFSPMLDIARDPRWGRIAESLGEDPFLAGVLGAAMVRGFQGDSLCAHGSMAACGKHFVGYGAAEGGRDYNTTWIPENLLREVYLKPFKAACDAGLATIMTAFNDINGIPASGNAFTIRQILRHEWKFKGFVVSDWTSVHELIEHGYAADARQAALKGLLAGVEMEMVSTDFYDHVKSLVESGQINPNLIDQAVRDILRVKYRLGLFDKSLTPDANAAARPEPDAKEVARKLAAESIVLLKNEGGTLPLAKSVGKIAVLGPLADSPADLVGTWSISADKQAVITPLAALRQVLGQDRIVASPGLKNTRDRSHEAFAQAVDAAKKADVVLLFLGEEAILSGEAHSRAFLNLPGAQESLVDEVAKAGKPMIAVILAGRPLTFQHIAAKVNAILYAWHPGTMGGPAICDIIFGESVPSGKLPVTFPRTVGQVPIYYAHRNTGRPPAQKDLGILMGTPVDQTNYVSKYLDVDYTPEYPFGFGLSYTRFEYGNPRLSSPHIPVGGKITVSAEVTNAGQYEADEIVQLYTHDVAASVTRPVRELKAFRRIHLKPGQKQTVEFPVNMEELAFYNDRMQLVTEPGRYQVWIGPNSSSGGRCEFEVARGP